MTENVNENVQDKKTRRPKSLPRIIGDFTEVMKGKAKGEIHNKLFMVYCDPDEIKKILEQECFVTASSEKSAIREFLSSLPITIVHAARKEYEARKELVLADWKDSLTQVGRDAQHSEGE